MKKLLVVIAICTSTFSFGQNITRQVADSACVCLHNRIELLTNENLRDTLTKCVVEYLVPFMDEVMEEHNLDGYTVENIRMAQSKIVAVLKEDCEVFKKDKKKNKRER